MSTRPCRQERRVLREARSRSLSRWAREHMAECDRCATAARIEWVLLEEADRAPNLNQLPDPTLIWWRSRQRAHLRKTEKATFPIQVAERLALALGVLGLLVGSSLNGFSPWPTLNRWMTSWADMLPQALPLEKSALILALTGSVILLVGFGLYSQWEER